LPSGIFAASVWQAVGNLRVAEAVVKLWRAWLAVGLVFPVAA